jgi:hypothetical protein
MWVCECGAIPEVIGELDACEVCQVPETWAWIDECDKDDCVYATECSELCRGCQQKVRVSFGVA